MKMRLRAGLAFVDPVTLTCISKEPGYEVDSSDPRLRGQEAKFEPVSGKGPARKRSKSGTYKHRMMTAESRKG